MALPAATSETTVVVTGASAGIGHALARELAAREHGLSLVARRVDALEALAGELLAEHGVTVQVHACDLADGEQRRILLAELLDGDRRVVGLCNNAGTAAFGRVIDHDPEEDERVFRVNALAVHDLTNHLARSMVEHGEGAVLNVGSILGFAPIPHNATYAATKAFVQSFSEALHTELAGTGVSCTTVSPGGTRTGIFDAGGAPGAVGFGPGLLWQDAEDVAREAVDAMAAGRRSVIPGWINKALALGYHLSPRTTFLPFARLAQSGAVRRRLLGDEGGGRAA